MDIPRFSIIHQIKFNFLIFTFSLKEIETTTG